MASLTKETQKRWRIQFMCVHQPGKRRTVRLSGLSKRQAEDVHRRIENIISSRLQRAKLEDSDSAWLGSLTDKFHAKLVKVGLDEARESAEPKEESCNWQLGKFLDDIVEHGYTSKGKPAAESTVSKWKGTVRFLKARLGEDTLLTEISKEDAFQFRRWLDRRKIKLKSSANKGLPMSENAKRKNIAHAKTFFGAAKRRGLIETNPFEELTSSTESNRNRDHYITPDDTRRLLDTAPDAQWRLMIALWRLAGLRKMEIFGLTWGDVLWSQGKVRIRSTKTKHIDGCGVRYAPLRDISTFLEDAFQAALAEDQASLPADAPVVTRFSRTNSNLDKPLKTILHQAGLVPWPKLFQNLRASCETQWLKEGHRADLVANWIGHSVKVQNDNYVQHTQEDIDNFNNCEPFKSGSLCASDDARNDENGPEMAEHVAHISQAKTLETNVFADQKPRADYPRQDSNL